MKSTEQNFWLDVGLFVTFVLTIFSGIVLWLVVPLYSAASFMGVNRQLWQTMHIYTSLVSLAGSAIHVGWHRTWLKALRNRPPASLPRKIKANRVVNRIIWITFLAASVFGIVGWFIQNNGPRVNLFSRVHVILSICWLMGIIVHLVFHRKWILSTIKRLWTNKAGRMEKIPAGLAKE